MKNIWRVNVKFQRYECETKYVFINISGKPYAKKNQYRIARSRMYRDTNVVKYIDSIQRGFISNEPAGFTQLQGDLTVSIKVFFPENRGDLDNAIQTVFDSLQGLVYKNDKQIKRYEYVEAFIDKDHPRIEFVCWEGRCRDPYNTFGCVGNYFSSGQTEKS